MAKNTDVLSQFSSAGNNAVGLINRVEDVTRKFQPGARKGSIVKSAQGNVFEFPVFFSNSIPIDYAEAVSSLLEQVYATYLQMAISINPVVDAASIKNGLQFADYKTNTNKYLECVDSDFQKDACHAVYQEGAHEFTFDMLSIEDKDARLINEAVEYQPLSEFSHFFQEAEHPDSYYQNRIPLPRLETNAQGNQELVLIPSRHANAMPMYDVERDANGNIIYGTLDEVRTRLINAEQVATNNRTNGNNGMEPAFDAYIRSVRNHNLGMDSQSAIDAASRAEDYEKHRNSQLDPVGDRLNTLNERRYNAARADLTETQAQRANNSYYRANDAITTGANTARAVIGAANDTTNAIYNIGTLGTRMKAAKLEKEKLEDAVKHLDSDRALKKTEVMAKAAAKAPQYIDDSKCQKLNTMKPLLMQVTINMLNKDESLQPINYIIGVKTYNRVVPASILPEVARYPLKEMDKISRKIKWRAGEMKFLKDLVFRIKEKKQTAADSRDPNRKWYRRLYELAHMKGDAPAAAVVQGKSLFATFLRDKQGKGSIKNGMIPNASIVMSQADVDNIKHQTDINLLKGSTAKTFCGELFLISLVIIDTDSESVKIMIPDMNNDYDVHSLAAVNKQLAMLDTAGTKTRDMFKLLG